MKVRFPQLASDCRATFCKRVQASGCGRYNCWQGEVERCGTTDHQEIPEVRKEGQGFPTPFLFPAAPLETFVPTAAHHRYCRDPCQSHSYKAAPTVQDDWLDNACTLCYFR